MCLLCCKGFFLYSFFNTSTLKLILDSLRLFVYPLFVSFLFSSWLTQTHSSYVLSMPRLLYRHLTVIQCKMSWQKRGFRWMTPWSLCLPEWAAVWWGSSLRSWSGPRWRWRKGSQRRWLSPLCRSGRPRTPVCKEEKMDGPANKKHPCRSDLSHRPYGRVDSRKQHMEMSPITTLQYSHTLSTHSSSR